jgi:hypothetical protein
VGRNRARHGRRLLRQFSSGLRAIHYAHEIAQRVGQLVIDTRAAVHIGECEMIDGEARRPRGRRGARTSASPVREKSLSRRPRKDPVAGSGFCFDNRGEHDPTGIPEPWGLYAVEPKAQ